MVLLQDMYMFRRNQDAMNYDNREFEMSTIKNKIVPLQTWTFYADGTKDDAFNETYTSGDSKKMAEKMIDKKYPTYGLLIGALIGAIGSYYMKGSICLTCTAIGAAAGLGAGYLIAPVKEEETSSFCPCVL